MENMEQAPVVVEEVKEVKAPKKNFFAGCKSWICSKVSNHVFMAAFLTLLSFASLIIFNAVGIFAIFSNALNFIYFTLVMLSAFGGFFYSFMNKVKHGDKNMDFLLALNIVILFIMF